MRAHTAHTSHDTSLALPTAAVLLGALGALILLPTRLPAQQDVQQPAAPDELRACYVPGSGTIYRVGTPDTPTGCRPGHAELTWPAGARAGGSPRTNGRVTAAAQVIDHGAFAALTDDYPQYLLADGVRQTGNGFAVATQVTSGSIPVSGAGKRLMWYAPRAALRAGYVSGTAWDDANVGFASVAFGQDAVASATNSFAFGFKSRASGLGGATALGEEAVASAQGATAIGRAATASGPNSTALGILAVASGGNSVAIGRKASTNGYYGSVVVGDGNDDGWVKASRMNQFVVRAQHFWLGKTNAVANPSGHFLTTSSGAYLSNGGTWTNSSDSARKHRFERVDGEALLARLAELPIQRWSYRAEDDTVRHLGPTAQGFRQAFRLGDSDRAIATVDADGVALAAAQALERRSRDQTARLERLERENVELRERLARLEGAERKSGR